MSDYVACVVINFGAFDAGFIAANFFFFLDFPKKVIFFLD